ncbi:MAG: hypothetical protein C0475_06225 [Planctomyces sp.]|nr:hypothetical protein [Planctomyces sp.]
MPVVELVIKPDGRTWAGRAADHFRALMDGPRDRAEEARRFRRQLGLPADRPVIMSGHQAGVWHAGILAKWLAAVRTAAACGGEAAWVVVDQDTEDFTLLRVPVRDAEPAATDHAPAEAPARAAAIALAPEELGRALRSDRPAGVLPSFTPHQPRPPEGTRWALAQLGPRLDSIAAALAGHVMAPGGARPATAAEQLAQAVRELIGQAHPGLPAPRLVYPTRLHATDLFSVLTERMAAEARACVSAYNDAVRAHGAHGLGTLLMPAARQAGGGKIELPLWRLDPNPPALGGRRRVYATEDGGGLPAPGQVVPRALCLTGLLRLAACDMFIHGLGGGATPEAGGSGGTGGSGEAPARRGQAEPDQHGLEPGGDGYDRATEAWIWRWLGRGLAPAVLATATVTLPLSSRAPLRRADLWHAQWKAHAAAHSPGLLGEQGAERQKRALAAMASDRSRPADQRRAIYERMHELIGAVRRARRDKLDEYTGRAAELRQRLGAQGVAHDRAWPFALHSPEDLDELSRRIAEALGAPGDA